MSRLLATARNMLCDPLALAELFLIGNITFLAVDVYIAHEVNDFAHRAEWIPVLFSLAAACLLIFAAVITGSIRPPLLPGKPGSSRAAESGTANSEAANSEAANSEADRKAASPRQWIGWTLGMVVGAGAIAVGLGGLIYHLASGFFQQQTLHNLVYAAPFAAPLSYAGLGLLAILNRTVPAESKDWARWVVFLALGGFLGNFVLTLADHAQNGFFDGREWIAVVFAALATGALLAVIVDYRHRPFLWLCLGLMVVEIAVGLLGWYYHVAGVLRSPMDGLWDKILYGPPFFAPMLFADVAILGALGIWPLLRDGAAEIDR